MPRTKLSFSSKFNEWVKSLSELERKHFELGAHEQIFCNVCSKMFNCPKKFHLDQHIQTAAHSASVKRSNGQRQVRVNDTHQVDHFNKDLCKAMLAADIPFNKLENPTFKAFLEKYSNRAVPSRWTLRTKNVKENYDDVIARIRNDLSEKYIWMGVDETTDKCGRFVANIIVGALDGTESKPRLLMSQELEKANSATVTQLILDALHFLWPGKKERETSRQFAVLLSDAAPYMIKAGKTLKKTYPGLLHVTCLAHGLHRVAETVRASYNNVDKLIGSVKAVFKKSPYRVRRYQELLPGTPLPPEAVLTRWGTWLVAAEFLTNNFEGIKSVIDSFDSSEAECIRKAQDLTNKNGIREQLAEITSNFAFLAKAIEKLESRNLPVMESVGVLESVQRELNLNLSAVGAKVKIKLEAVLKKNPDIDALIRVSQALQGNSQVLTGMDPSLIVALKYCPTTSVELERGFSMEKAILTDRRQSFTMKNLEMYLVCHFEMSMNETVPVIDAWM